MRAPLGQHFQGPGVDKTVRLASGSCDLGDAGKGSMAAPVVDGRTVVRGCQASRARQKGEPALGSGFGQQRNSDFQSRRPFRTLPHFSDASKPWESYMFQDGRL